MTDEELITRLREPAFKRGVGAVVHNTHACFAANRLEELVKENAEFQQTFDMQWKADMRAIKMWQEAHPGNDLVWPDGAKLTVWLMERVDALVKERDEALEWLSASQGYIADAVYALDKQEKAEARAEQLEAALRLLVTCVEDGCFCSEMKMATAIDEALAALKGADHDAG